MHQLDERELVAGYGASRATIYRVLPDEDLSSAPTWADPGAHDLGRRGQFVAFTVPAEGCRRIHGGWSPRAEPTSHSLTASKATTSR